MLKIDGSILEGGGQIIRNALSLSCILKKPIHIQNIRSGRPKPGLAAQHNTGLQLLARMTNAEVIGDYIGSTEIKFYPKVNIRGGRYDVDIKTAGSISLILQSAIPVALFADSQVNLHIHGGTNVSNAPQIDFFIEVFRPNLEAFGGTFDLTLHKRGYFPKGQGYCEVTITPIKQIQGIEIVNPGKVDKVLGWSYVSGNLDIRIAKQVASYIENRLKQLGLRSNIYAYKEDSSVSRDSSAGVILACITSNQCVMGASDLSGRNHRISGEEVSNEIINYVQNGICVDQFVQDQLIIYMALAQGTSKILTSQVTLHTRTGIYIAELFGEGNIKFNINDRGKYCSEITCLNGLGCKNRKI